MKRVAIIGAGNSGIGAFNACREQGLDVICYEKNDNICGMWRFREEEIEGSASIYRSTSINTSKEITAFSTFPAPDHYPNYMHNIKMCEYIEQFADRIGFKEFVKLRHELIKCVPNHDYEETGRWRLTIKNLNDNTVFDEVFDGVMLCTGHNNKPNMPVYKGQHLFKGDIIHSHAYKDIKNFENKRVIVVGIGNSAGDIAVELSHHCPEVYLSTRTGTWVSHRVGHKGQPFDSMFLRRWVNSMFNIGPWWLSNGLIEGYLNIKFDHKLYGLKPKHRYFSQHIFVNDDLPKKIVTGLIVVKGDIERFTEDGVVFEGEDEVTPVDAVVMATGYQFSYPFLEGSGVEVNKKDFNIYKNVFHPTSKHPKTLAFIGLVLPIGPVLPIAELQSRWFALLMADKLKLPSEKQMLKEIKDRKKWVKKHFPNWEKHCIEVYYVQHVDELAKIIGVKPNLFKYFFTDPKLWSELYFGPLVPYHYRLTGPNPWSGARKAIMTVNKRISAPMKTKRIN